MELDKLREGKNKLEYDIKKLIIEFTEEVGPIKGVGVYVDIIKINLVGGGKIDVRADVEVTIEI